MIKDIGGCREQQLNVERAASSSHIVDGPGQFGDVTQVRHPPGDLSNPRKRPGSMMDDKTWIVADGYLELA